MGSGTSQDAWVQNPSFTTYCIQAGWLWANDLPSLGLQFFTCKMGNNNSIHFIELVGLKELRHIKHLEQCLAHKKNT